MTRHEAALIFIRLRDVIDETITAGIELPEALGQGLRDAGRAYDELTHPKPDITRPAPILVRQGRQYAPPARPRPYIIDTASVTR